MKILFVVGLIFLCINILRFLLGNVAVIKSNSSVGWKIWNITETIMMAIVLVILIINYYK